MKKILIACMAVAVCMMSTMTFALSSKSVDVLITKLTVVMKTNPSKFEAMVAKIYTLVDTLSLKQLEKLMPLITKLNALVDVYNESKAEKNPAPKANAIPTITAEQLATLNTLMVLENKGTSDVVLLEFSDIECPFCIRHHTNGTIASVIKSFEGKLSNAFLHFPLSFHAQALPTAIASECVKAQLGKDAFYSFLHEVFTLKKLTAEAVTLAAKNIKSLDQSIYTSCLASKDAATLVQNQINIGTAFGVRGTPSTVIFNTKTRAYIMVSGAVPAEMITSEVKKMIK